MSDHNYPEAVPFDDVVKECKNSDGKNSAELSKRIMYDGIQYTVKPFDHVVGREQWAKSNMESEYEYYSRNGFDFHFSWMESTGATYLLRDKTYGKKWHIGITIAIEYIGG